MDRRERPRNTGCVLRSWVMKLPWKMQSVLMSGMRGPDDQRVPELKELIRFIRLSTQNDAGVDIEDSYMDTGPLDYMAIKRAVEYQTVHFSTHLLYALEIIWQFCPDGPHGEQAGELYKFLVDDWHLRPETRAALEARLG